METFELSRALFGAFVGWALAFGILAVIETRRTRAQIEALRQKILDSREA